MTLESSAFMTASVGIPNRKVDISLLLAVIFTSAFIDGFIPVVAIVLSIGILVSVLSVFVKDDKKTGGQWSNSDLILPSRYPICTISPTEQPAPYDDRSTMRTRRSRHVRRRSVFSRVISYRFKPSPSVPRKSGRKIPYGARRITKMSLRTANGARHRGAPKYLFTLFSNMP